MKNSAKEDWGIKEIIVLAHTCHIACTSCWGTSVSQCWTCEQDTPMKLSGTTCNESCLSGYGDTFDGMVCVLCDLHCTACFELAYNCTACRTWGTYRSYLWPANFSCENPCPEGMYGNSTDSTCYDCDPECVSCGGTSSHCYECDKLLGYAWNDYTCYNPCPIGTFLDNNDTNCSDCSPFCIECTLNSTFCSSCTLNGTYMAYLYNN